jgi:signal transduction histidine kinase
VRVLRGEPVDTIPVTFRDLTVVQVDWRQLRRWGLSESRVPAAATILFREPTAWQQYRVYILGALVVVAAQTVLIAGLLVQRDRRWRAERRLFDSQARLRQSYERIRDLGGRLLHAQDRERSHIARELHDDVSQQLALVEMDVKLLGSGGPDDAKGELLERIQTVARSVRDLSHRLHPARLRLIGLVAALKGLQAEMSHAGVDVAFTHENVPAGLAPEITVCLFRVAQEALQNAVKYSGARHISVALRGGNERLELTTADDGAGFDVDAAWGKGLGLVSMRERVEAVGGELQIQSAPGAGARVQISVPLTMGQAGTVAV